MNSSSPDPLFMSAQEAARLADLSTASIYTGINRGELEAVRLCSRYQIRRSAFDEWIERARVRPSNPIVAPPPRSLPVDDQPGSFRYMLRASRSGRRSS
jgi:excisionase family DNA binding protein